MGKRPSAVVTLVERSTGEWSRYSTGTRPTRSGTRSGTRSWTGQPPHEAHQAFTRRYEEHKRTCGWYAPDDETVVWYPPMFQGRDYDLYETLRGPYATRLAANLPSGAISTLAGCRTFRQRCA